MKHHSASHFKIEALKSTDHAREKLEMPVSMLDDIPVPQQHPAPPDESRAVTEQQLRLILKARRNRAQFFEAELFADPAWDILLELYAAELGQRRMSITSLCIGAAVPATTALRWLRTLEKKGLLVCKADPCDGRRVFVRLSGTAANCMAAYFDQRSGPLIS